MPALAIPLKVDAPLPSPDDSFPPTSLAVPPGSCTYDARAAELGARASDALYACFRRRSRHVHPYHRRGDGRDPQGYGRAGNAAQGQP